MAVKNRRCKVIAVPADKTSLKRFLGLTSYYRRFMESYATIAAPLYELLKDDAPFIWTENSQAAFDCLKNCLTSAPTLCAPNFADSFQVTTDASGLIHKVAGSPTNERSDGDDSRLGSNITVVFCRFGIPEVLHSDQGATFESETLRLLLNSFGIKKTRTTPYHPQSDGLVERANRTLLQLFRTYMVKDADWEDHLPLMLIILGCGVRSTVCQDVVVFDGCRLAVFSNSLDLPLWGFHLTVRAFGDCLWPADCRYVTELGLTRIEEGFLHSFWCIRWRPDQLLEWCRAVGGR
ncbi:putative integrase core domain protein [Trichinella spiralis]|uniref:putative integrase core domain protein n=1 Tax=Trichinella spiralis TaxID=6334 RepID=UPI0001EFCD6D|nr:putative integrase core domain protein [Trichinella spiralis]